MGSKPLRIKTHYGRVSLVRVWCPSCLDYAIESVGACARCGEVADDLDIESVESKRESIFPCERRSSLSRELCDRITRDQGWACAYCGCDIHGNAVLDHWIPRSRGGADLSENLVASCPTCNLIKSDRVFSSLEEAVGFILPRRNKLERKRACRLPALRDCVREEESVPSVLRPDMPNRIPQRGES